ncbi:MAG: hypothetical protein JXR83_04245 [Deltaproteobacteria bacterium]|nr:hypothetical protein [Deltaproteobacteria bacterium]
MPKRLLVVVGMCLAAVVVLAAAPPKVAPPKKVFVSSLQPRNTAPAVVEMIDGSVCNAIHGDKRFEPVCPPDIKAILEYDSLNNAFGNSSRCADNDCWGRLAKRVQAEMMLSGSVAKLDKSKFVLTLDLVDVTSAKSLGHVEEQVTGTEEQLYKRAEDAVKKLLGQVK